MNRRTFLWTIGSFSTMALLAGANMDWAIHDSAPSDHKSIMTKNIQRPGSEVPVCVAWIKKGEKAEALLQQVVLQATNFSWLKKGDSVLIKLTLNSDKPFPATSDPSTLACMIKMLRQRGAGKIFVGDQSGVHSVHWTRTLSRGSSRECCRLAGLLSVIEENGAIPYFFEEQGYHSYVQTYPTEAHHWKEPIFVADILSRVEHIIYLPRVSSHLISDITSGQKIGVGFLREDSRRSLHTGGDDFFAMYEEINTIPDISKKLRLVLSSGRSVISLWGPDSGYITEPDYGPVFASENILGHELFAYAWLQYNREHMTPSYLYNLEKNARALINLRSRANRSFVNRFWTPESEAPDIPNYQPGRIYRHPAIANSLRRLKDDGCKIIVQEIATNPSAVVREYLYKQLAVNP